MPMSLRASSRRRAWRRPKLMSKVPSRCGSLMRPFQPTVVRRFFEVHAHHNQQFFFVFFAQGQKAGGRIRARLRVVDRAGADNQQQALVAAVHQIGDFSAGLVHQIGGGIADGQFIKVGNRAAAL